MPSFTVAMVAASITVLANGLGALPFVFIRSVSDKWTRAGWSLAGGLMLSASIFNLIYPGIEEGGILPVSVAIFLGAGFIEFRSDGSVKCYGYSESMKLDGRGEQDTKILERGMKLSRRR